MDYYLLKKVRYNLLVMYLLNEPTSDLFFSKHTSLEKLAPHTVLQFKKIKTFF